jgi:hypothetical protein
MQFEVYRQSRWGKRWKQLGVFSDFTKAHEHVDYLIKNLPCGYRFKFRINSAFRSYEVSDLGQVAA